MDNQLDARLLLRPTEAALALGVSRSKIYDLIASKAIPSIKLGGSVRVPAIQLQAWIDAQLRDQSAPKETP